jgi:hypothetical protein
MKRSCAKLALSSLVVLSVAACGGGGGDAGSRPSAFGGEIDPAAVGAYVGNIAVSPNPDNHFFLTLLLEDGSFWMTYGAEPIGDHQITGFMQGTMAVVSNGSYSSMDARDFGLSPVLPATMSGSYTAGAALSGTAQYGGGLTTSFSGTPFYSGSYYNTPARLSDIAGTWPMTLVSGTTSTSVSLNVSNTGVIGGVSVSGCAFSGSVAPRASGKNVFDITLRFGGSPCPLPRQAVNGIAISYVTIEGQELVTLLVNSDRTIGVRASGTR